MTIADQQIGLNLKALRMRRGMRQADLAEALYKAGTPISQVALSGVELGQRSLKLREAQALTEILNIDLYQLLDRS